MPGEIKAVTTATPRAERLVDCSPRQLREMAERLEKLAANAALPGEVVLMELTRGVTLVYNPGVTRHDLAMRPAVLEEGNR